MSLTAGRLACRENADKTLTKRFARVSIIASRYRVQEFSGSRTVTSRNLLIHNGATNAT